MCEELLIFSSVWLLIRDNTGSVLGFTSTTSSVAAFTFILQKASPTAVPSFLLSCTAPRAVSACYISFCLERTLREIWWFPIVFQARRMSHVLSPRPWWRFEASIVVTGLGVPSAFFVVLRNWFFLQDRFIDAQLGIFFGVDSLFSDHLSLPGWVASYRFPVPPLKEWSARIIQ